MLVRATPIFPPPTPTRSTPPIDADGVLVGEVRERRPCPDIVGIGCHPSEQEGAVECRLVQEPSPCSRIPSEHPGELGVVWGPASLLIRESVDRGGALHRHCDGQREGDHPENHYSGGVARIAEHQGRCRCGTISLRISRRFAVRSATWLKMPVSRPLGADSPARNSRPCRLPLRTTLDRSAPGRIPQDLRAGADLA